MKYKIIEEFRGMFLRQKALLLGESRKILEKELSLQQEELSDQMDLISMERETSMRIRLRSREALFLKKIDLALSKIKAGTFGMCEICGEEIEVKRLYVRPTANLCFCCKEEREQMEKEHIDHYVPKSLGPSVSWAI